ncbi:MAG: lipopolysaccharide heptosyltransferase II [Candidatus Omnitrophota bacterium]
MNRILIVNVNWIGDVLFSTPFIRAIRRAYPRSFIAALVVPRCVPILKSNPHLNEIIVYDEQGEHRGVRGKLRLIRLIRAKSFDTVFLLHRSLTRTLICWLAGIPQRIGYYTKKRKMFLTKSILPPGQPAHKVEYFLNIAKEIGITQLIEDKDYELIIDREDKEYIDNILRENNLEEANFLVVINPGGNWDLKRWPKERFAQLADRLITGCQAKIIITGAEKDIGLAEDIASLMNGKPLILCGRTTLGQLAALMARVSLVIANDSGPMHIAVSQKTKVICLFGPTSPAITGPYGRGNYKILQQDIGCPVPCYRLNCPDNRCMKAISVAKVLEAVNQMRSVGKNGHQ